MDKPMKLWEVVRGFETGSYLHDEWFVNDHGQEVGFDGVNLIGIEKADVNAEYRYAGVRVVRPIFKSA